MSTWWAIQWVLVLAWLVSAWAVRWAAPGANRVLRGLVGAGLLVVVLPWRSFDGAERLVPVADWAALEPVVEGPTVRLVREVAVSDGAVGLSVVLVAVALGLFGLEMTRRAVQLGRSTVLHRIGRVTVAVGPVATPCTVWFGRSWILLDPATAEDAEACRMAVAHEAQHIRHGDPVFAWWAVALVVACAPNPFAWAWLRNLAELDEHAVDAALLGRKKVRAKAYGRLLVASAVPTSPLRIAVGLGHATPLHRRLHMLASPRSRRPLAWLLVGSLLLGGAALAAPRAATVAMCDGFVADLDVPAHALVDDAAANLRSSGFLKRSLARRPAHAAYVRGRLKEARLPLALEAVVLVESGYDPGSWVDLERHGSGAGLWMFIPATARTYGLRVDDEVDERLDVERSTSAAIALLSDLHERYDDWGLALAAYNQGPQKVDGAIAKAGSRDALALTETGALGPYVPMVYGAMDVLGARCVD